jgi:hypothetical protein
MRDMAKTSARYAKAQYIKDEERWKAESDARTLREAMEIRKDKKRLKRAKTVINEQLKALQDAAENT